MADPLGGLGEPRPAPEPQPQAQHRPPRLTTIALLGVMFAFFAAEYFVGGDPIGESSQALLRLGALYPPALRDGDWWRLGSYAFLHIGWTHIAFNGYALWVLGPQIELTFGSNLTLGLFAATALAAGGASAAWNIHFDRPALVAGASGGVFGLFGATIALFIRIRHDLPPEARRGVVRSVLINLALNVAIAFYAHVDNAAHVGGLVSGVLLGLIAPLGRRPRMPWHRPVQVALVASAFVLACMEGAAVAWAAHPRPRTLRNAGVEAQIPGLLVPVGDGSAALPEQLVVKISTDPAPLTIEPGEDALRIGDRTWLHNHSAEEDYEVTRLAASAGKGSAVIELYCRGDLCKGEKIRQFYEPIARSLKTVP